MAKFGIEFSEDLFYGLAGTPSEKIVSLLLEQNGVSGNPTEIALQKELAFLDTLDQVRPIQPVVDIALRYRSTHALGVGSGSNRSVVEKILKQIGLSEIFQAVVAAEDTQRHKPEPDVFLEVAKRINVPPEKCCVFEDADLGIESARRGGMEVFDIRTI